MSNVRCVVAVSLALCFLIAAGCGRQGPKPSDRQDRNLDRLIDELSLPNPAVQSRAADDLLKLPPDQLAGAVQRIEQAYQVERNPKMKKTIKKVLDHAKGR